MGLALGTLLRLRLERSVYYLGSAIAPAPLDVGDTRPPILDACAEILHGVSVTLLRRKRVDLPQPPLLGSETANTASDTQDGLLVDILLVGRGRLNL